MSYGVALRNGIPFTLGTIAALCVNATGQAWSPSALWPTGTEAGMWIDPSNLTSQWQDYTGTTPVSTPGTVADSSNPVGLALDLRLGAPEALGPEIWTDPPIPDLSVAVKIGAQTYEFTGVTGYIGFWYGIGQTVGRSYKCSVTVTGLTSGMFAVAAGGTGLIVTSNGSFSNIQTVGDVNGCNIYANGVPAGATVFVSVKEVPGNHLSQATSTARPLLSAYDGQTLGPGDTYPSTGFPVYQKYDGTDDGMATASFAAGTLSNAMDCMIAVRRDAGTVGIAGMSDVDSAGYFFGFFHEPNNTDPNFGSVGTPTTWCDGVQLAGGTATTRATLYNALTAGEWHILEWRGLDLSAFTAAVFSAMTSGTYRLNGAQGGILLFPSSTSAADRDAARTWLGAKVGLTL